jgi:hypothetical protein
MPLKSVCQRPSLWISELKIPPKDLTLFFFKKKSSSVYIQAIRNTLTDTQRSQRENDGIRPKAKTVQEDT